MCPERAMPAYVIRRTQQGLGAIAAIVVLVILATLAGFITTLSTSQQVGSGLDVEGSRTYLAAHAGLEWGKFQTKAGACTASSSLTIEGKTVVVTCSVSGTGDAVEVGLGAIYALSATACNASPCPATSPGPQYVERKLSALVER
jgi:MSHA biogenesis protein MshP